MTLGFNGVFAEIGALWRANRDLLVRIAGVFFFLPAFAVYLFVRLPNPDPEMAVDERVKILTAYYEQNIGMLFSISAGVSLATMIGSALLFAMLLGPERITLRAGLARIGHLLPSLLLLWALLLALTVSGLMLFVIPALYIAGRTLIALPVLVAEPGRGGSGALIEGIRRTHGRGWLLFLFVAMIFLASNMAGTIPAALLPLVGEDSVPAAFVYALTAATAAAGTLAQALLQAAVYRLLLPKQGM
jgi:hypothetical protein